jgi:hypothetical protein
MFVKACSQIRNAIYGVNGMSQLSPDGTNYTNATAFMIAPGILVTAAHFIHVENDISKPIHKLFEAIRTPDIGQNMEVATLIAEDPIRDVSLLRIDNPRSNAHVVLEPNIIPIGTNCGSLGFPLASVTIDQNRKMFILTERFQGANISSFQTQRQTSGRLIPFYETDSLMYAGSSGCPGFLDDARVFGMMIMSIVDPKKMTHQLGLSCKVIGWRFQFGSLQWI